MHLLLIGNQWKYFENIFNWWIPADQLQDTWYGKIAKSEKIIVIISIKVQLFI